ncbi:MAG: acetamidase/formamidase family protein [Candidatus Zipacnadales bacterium]
MNRISRDKNFTQFTPYLTPVCEVDPGEWVLVETWDCYGGETLAGKSRHEVAADCANPATGPLMIRGLQAGQTLRCTIANITLAPRGFVGTRLVNRFIDIVDGFARFSDSLRLPLSPMIGVIGVAPAEGAFNTTWPGPHGGNLDTIDVKAGAQVFLRAQVEGGLLGLGDVHACQGDGEIAGQGIEIPAEIVLRLDIEPTPLPITNPYVIVDGCLSIIASAPTLEESIAQAVEDMVCTLGAKLNLSTDEARMLISLIGQVRVSQVVNPLMTARVVMPILW